MQLTKHAIQRGQQRGIRIEIVQVVSQYGRENNRRDGATEFRLSSADVDLEIARLKQEQELFERARDVIVIEKDGDILTSYHATKKTRRN